MACSNAAVAKRLARLRSSDQPTTLRENRRVSPLSRQTPFSAECIASAFLSWNFGFAEEHECLYVIVASIVLLILAYGLIGSALPV